MLRTGEREFDYELPKERGGAIFVKAGSIIPMQDHAPALRDYRPEKLFIHVYPGKDAEFTLYEDDYATYSYEKGEIATTKFELKNNVLYISPRQGSFENMPKAFDFKVIWHHPDGSTNSYAVDNFDGVSETVVIEDK